MVSNHHLKLKILQCKVKLNPCVYNQNNVYFSLEIYNGKHTKILPIYFKNTCEQTELKWSLMIISVKESKTGFIKKSMN